MSRRNRPTAFSQSFGDSDPDARDVSLAREATQSNSLYASSSRQPTHSTSRPTAFAYPSTSQSTAASGSRVSLSSSGTRAGVPSSAGSSRSSRNVAREDPPPHARSHSTGKRKEGASRGDAVPPRPGKRSRPQPLQYLDLSRHEDAILETADTIIFGEEERDEQAEKPIRLLTDFTIFEPARNNALVSLRELSAVNTRQFRAIGMVGPVHESEEDAGQELEVEGDEVNARRGYTQKIHTTAIVTFAIDYNVDEGPLYLQTEWAFYILKSPSQLYSSLFVDFYSSHRIAQLAVSMVHKEGATTSRDTFLELYEGVQDPFLGVVLTKESILAASSTVAAVVELPEYNEARYSRLIEDLISQRQTPERNIHIPSQSTVPAVHDLDIYVIRPEHQNTTRVTPFIQSLSTGLFYEKLHVLGSRLPHSPADFQASAHKELIRILKKTLEKRSHVEPHGVEGDFLNSVRINHTYYQIGDTVLAPAGSYSGRENLPLPQNMLEISKVPQHHTIADYFWFGKIIYINQKNKTAHLQWFEHSSKSLLQEIHDPSELFLTKTCGDLQLSAITAKVSVQYNEKYEKPKSPDYNCWKKKEFHCSFLYNQNDGSFLQAKDLSIPAASNHIDSCPVCAHDAAENFAAAPQVVENGSGIAFDNHSYHLNDFALVESLGGPCLVGQIIGFDQSAKARDLGACNITLRVLSSLNEILGKASNTDVIKNEQELVLTDEIVVISAVKLIRPCTVKAEHAFGSPHDIHTYLLTSPYHFLVRFHCQKPDNHHWQQRQTLEEANIILTTCQICFKGAKSDEALQEAFKKNPPLRAFDPFGGCGAFALSMQDTGVLKLTHAVEISPSAASTLSKNSPDTLVYNQCANLVLEQAMKLTHGQNPPALESIQHEALPPMLKPEDIDCVVAGFPCQPHSTLNMYQKANDRKSHLVLNLLSWIEFLKPQHCLFENVRGFIHYNLNSTQKDRYSTTGGIPAGGLTFFVRALLAMGYQVRFALLEAAHYGTPQARVRFFLIASQLGHTLPTFPTPLYDIPIKDSLQIHLPHGLHLSPIPATSGMAPFRYVSVDDAISDLPWFDWRNPLNPGERARVLPSGEVVPLLTVNPEKPTVGLRQPGIYRTDPTTWYQQKARAKQELVKQLQHFTRPLKKETIARVTYIGLRPGADFQDLFKPGVPRSLIDKEWQIMNPSSAVARRGFRDRFYARLDKDKWFHTTVTNVEPMAKQSYVLNPYCKRVVTVRELARSQGFPDHFQFYSVTDQVVKTVSQYPRCSM
ncbi:S-adenosyl-L-methionine-dependent methyltransferase [Trametopsis cervina]|nr:S-adenosyl-L-methionine-dependent methyltransferase [Trametopsis cervina]